MVWDGFRFIAGSESGQTAVSADGAAWTFTNSDPEFRPLWGVEASRFWRVAVGALGKVIASSDANATAWSAHDSKITLHLQDVVENGSCFMAVGEGGGIITWCPPTIFIDGFEPGGGFAQESSNP